MVTTRTNARAGSYAAADMGAIWDKTGGIGTAVRGGASEEGRVEGRIEFG